MLFQSEWDLLPLLLLEVPCGVSRGVEQFPAAADLPGLVEKVLGEDLASGEGVS